MKTFLQFEEEHLGSYNKHKIKVKVSKDGGPKHHVDVKVFAHSMSEAKGRARLHLQSKGYTTHSAVHQGIDYNWVKKEQTDMCNVCGQTPCNCTHISESYEQAEEHKNKASKALETSDMESYHHHMSQHHEHMGQWHESKGRHSAADREYAKAEEHHEKGINASKSTSRSVKSTNEEAQINELSSELLARYKEKAGAAATAADKAKKYDLGHKRFKGILKATFKQFANDAKK